MAPTLHLIFKTHLDLGFTGYARDVRRQYHDHFIPMALDTGEHFLKEDPANPKFVWTTGSWLIWDHLETQPADKVARLEAGIRNGIIRWHALPFTTHTELMSPALVREALSLSQELDAGFGLTTTATKMTDVPGHTIGLVPLLAEAGVKFLHIGVNSASTPPDVPPVFRWQAPDGSEVVVMYQSEYGTTLVPEGMQSGIAFAHTMDNMGPQNVGAVVDSFHQLTEANPDFAVRASTLDAFGTELWERREALPAVTQEIGDSWIHGIGSAPHRVSRYLAARDAFEGFTADLTPPRRAFARHLLQVPEHTWGVDIKTYLRDEIAWDRPAFETARKANTRFAIAEGAWAEQDAIIDKALTLLPDADRTAIEPGATPRLVGDEGAAFSPDTAYTLGDFALTFDPGSGALVRLRKAGETLLEKAAGTQGLFAFEYESHSAADFEAYKKSYLTAWYRWGVQDHGKPGLENAATQTSDTFTCRNARIAGLGATTLGITADPDPRAAADLGAPQRVHTIYEVVDGALTVTVTLAAKPPNRMPEAGFLTFTPANDPDAWTMDKLGQTISPLNVVAHGNRQLHAVDAVSGKTASGRPFRLETHDAPLFNPGGLPFLEFAHEQPDMAKGGRFNLFNNKWGTNFSMWCEGTLAYRFTLRI